MKNSAIILTSAWLICIKKPFDDWSHKDYAPVAKVEHFNLNMLLAITFLFA